MFIVSCDNELIMDSNYRQILRKYFGAEHLLFLILTALFILIPFFFIPSAFFPLPFAKSLLVLIGTVVALVSFLIILIKKGSVIFLKSPILAALAFLSAVYLLSSIFSSSSVMSFFGYGFEIGTFSSILLMTILVYLVSISFQEPKKLFIANAGFLLVSGILVLIETVLILSGGGPLPEGILGTLLSNTVGKTNELAIFFGITALMTLVALEILKFGKIHKSVLHGILILSLFVISAVGFSTVWYVLGVIILLFFIYQMTFLNSSVSRMSVVSSAGNESSSGNGRETRLQSPRRKIAPRTLIVAVIALLLILPIGRDLTQVLTAKSGINNFEVRPSWSATQEIFKNTLKTDPLLGSGPNRFSTQWQLYRPDINLSNFWNVNFDYGIGFIPTALVETGIIGGLAWLAFILSILYVGFRALSVRTIDQMTRYFVLSSLSVTLFLWTTNVLYAPGPAIFTLSFFFTGLFVASAVLAQVHKSATVSFLAYPKISFAAVTLAVCLLLAGAGLGYMLFERGRSSFYFQKGTSAINLDADLDKGESLILRALRLVKNDIYYRALAELKVIKINNLIAAVSGKTEASEQEKIEFQDLLTDAIESARLAEKRDSANFENRAVVGKVYETIIPIQIAGAYEASKSAYEEALKLSPRNPSLFLALARVEVANNNLVGAEEYINKAFGLKWNYPDAIFLQSQIDVAKGNLPAAIKSVEQLAVVSPNDPLVYFRLGLLKYEAKDFRGAIQGFEKSISLVPVYANAKYFLGLSYAKIGRLADAVAQFEGLESTNPENREIDLILANLKAGREPFADAPVTEPKPEKRKELPVSESN